MRLAGYTREEPPIAGGPSAFAQSEALRRFAADRGHLLVAVCTDRVGADGDEAAGLRALLAIAESHAVEGVALASLRTLGDTMEDQEIHIWELRSAGVAVLSADEADDKQLAAEPADAARATIRELLARNASIRRRLHPPTP